MCARNRPGRSLSRSCEEKGPGLESFNKSAYLFFAVVFLSDNGADQTGSNAPYRSGKGSVYEGGIRVPCLLRWPGQLPAGATSQQPTCAQDL